MGNPGSQYEGTRHNAGFEVVEALAWINGLNFNENQFNVEIASGDIRGNKIVLAKPQSFMNLSGNPVNELVGYFKTDLSDLLIICDDVTLEVGRIRFRPNGSDGGHNGLGSIEEHLGTQDYPRLRIGVGSPDEDMVEHVLGQLNEEEIIPYQTSLITAVIAIEDWVRNDINYCMNKFNC